MFVEWRAKQEGRTIEHYGVAPVVVLSWNPRTVQSLAKALDAKVQEQWFYPKRFPIYTGRTKGRRVSFAYVPVGAPGTVMMMEEMIVCGARAFIGLGWAGSIQPKAPVGTFIIPTSCISEEGTSTHYMDKHISVRPSPRLASTIQDSCEKEGVMPQTGPVWTTDAPYRETLSKIKEYHNRGVVAVDMETSAMYALGHVRKVNVCNLLIISDELWHEWRPAFGQPELREASAKAKQVVLRTLGTNLADD